MAKKGKGMLQPRDAGTGAAREAREALRQLAEGLRQAGRVPGQFGGALGGTGVVVPGWDKGRAGATGLAGGAWRNPAPAPGALGSALAAPTRVTIVSPLPLPVSLGAAANPDVALAARKAPAPGPEKGGGGAGPLAGVLKGAALGRGGLPSLGMAAAAGGMEGGAAGALAAVGGPAGIAAAAITMLAGAAKDAAFKMLDLAKFANPAQALRFNMALEDVAGVVGQRFGPVLEKVTVIVRLFGDFLATVLPSEAEMSALMEELQPVIDEFKGALQEIAPYVKGAFKGALTMAVIGLRVFADAVKWLMNALGVKGGPKMKDSFGAAPREAKWGDIESVGRDAAQAALTQATSRGGANYPALSAGHLEVIRRTVANIEGFIKNPVGTAVKMAAEPVVGAMGDAENTKVGAYLGGILGWPPGLGFGR